MSAVITTDETLVIEARERVPLHFALASIGNRFIACAIDHAIQVLTLITLIIFFLAIAGFSNFGSRVSNAPKWIIALLIILIFVLMSGYFAFFEWIWNGQTPGKRWMKLRVIREDGRPIGFFEAMVRNLLRNFDVMPSPFYSIGLISVFATDRDQRVGDLVAEEWAPEPRQRDGTARAGGVGRPAPASTACRARDDGPPHPPP